MNRPHVPSNLPDPTNLMTEGWHCLHLYYKVDQAALASLSDSARAEGREHVIRTLDPDGEMATERLQVSIASGHRADIGLILMDPDPLKIDGITQEIRNSAIGPALQQSYSFVSITEISEYVPSVEQYAERLQREGTRPDDPAYEAKLNAYSQRLPAMNKQRMYPDIPPFPVIAFYHILSHTTQ